MEGEYTTFFRGPKFPCFSELNFEKFTGDSLGEENFSHYFRNLIDGLEITPLVQRGSTLPVL